jgi:hypothetical protein
MKSLARFRKRQGRCYELAFLVMLRESAAEQFTLVHGHVKPVPDINQSIDHAWMEDRMASDLEKKLAKEQAAGFKDRMENSPPIGAGPDGRVVVYKRVEDIPDDEPQIVTK